MWDEVGAPGPSDSPSFYEESPGDEDMEEEELEEEEGDPDADLFLTEGVWTEAADILRAALSDPKLCARAHRIQKRIIEDLNELSSDLGIPGIFED